MRSLIFAALFCLALPANAAPVTWVLEDFTFDDGGTASGSFIYDADLDTYSSVDITTTAGSVLDGEHYAYQSSTPFGSAFTASDLPDLTGVPALLLEFSASLTNAGGTVGVNYAGSVENYCANSDCSFGAGPPDMRFLTSGTVTSVPIPAAVWLFGSALAGLGWLRRKQTL